MPGTEDIWCDILCDMTHLPPVKHERFARPPLKAVVGQIRFPTVLRMVDKSFVAPFQDAIRDEYPEVLDETQFGIVVGPAGAVQTEPAKQLRLRTADGTWSSVLTPDYLSLEAGPAYTDSMDFADRFTRIWTAALEHFRPTRRAQQGLRYVNYLEGDHSASQWRALINPDLMGPIGGDELGDDVEQWVSDFRLARPNGTLILRHGFIKGSSTSAAGYLLDFDYFTQHEPELVGVDAVLATFAQFHDELYSLFRWCVTDKALETFRAIRAGE